MTAYWQDLHPLTLGASALPPGQEMVQGRAIDSFAIPRINGAIRDGIDAFSSNRKPAQPHTNRA